MRFRFARKLWVTAVVVVVSAALACLSSLAAAQPLADRVPADAFAYIGWRGTDALGPAYANSHLAGVVSSMNLKDVRERTIPSILDKLAQTNHVDVAQLQANFPLLERMWKRPTVLYVAPGTDANGDAEPRVAILCDAGDGAAELHRSLTALLQQLGKDVPGARTATDGRFVVVTFGYKDAAIALKPASVLRDSPAFATALKQVDADAAYTAYVDIERITQTIDQQVARDKSSNDDVRAWTRVRDALGLAGLRRIVTTGGFAGQDWSTRTFIEAPAPRRGLLSLLGDQQVRESTLNLIPQVASYAAVRQCDPAKVLAQVRRAATAAGPEAQRHVDEALAKAAQVLGMDVREVLEPLGDQWVMFGEAGVSGAPAAAQGVTIVNPLDDAPRAEAVLKKLSAVIVQRLSNDQFALTARDQQIGDVTVHTLIAPQGQPSWAVHKGKLYLATSPQGVAEAIKASDNAGGGGNIAHNDKFAALLRRLGAPRMSSFEFADLPQTAAVTYPQMQGLLVAMGMLAAPQGVWVPGDLLPPLDRLRPYLTPGGTIAWVDDTGWHSRGVMPFPGTRLLSGQQAGSAAVGVTALGVSILLPSLNRARETANRVKCASNERQVGQAILLYSNDHQGKYPPDLGTLITNPGKIDPDLARDLAKVGGVPELTPSEFACPSSDNDVPSSIGHAAKAAQAKWVNENSSYVYVGQGKTSRIGEDELVLYEKEGNHDQEGMNMLFGDGHVEWLPTAEARATIATKRLRQPATMPAR